ncbi:protein FAR1-RELATED SEQUENCE 4-like [Rhododendron vialii]|uniref:protein FAR1-RELATED SEQUENCE 4-like n=1 Tax=Rhododendron vialii TaxID=182163 RepID=UPI00265F7AD1|nr:protein FAR1-RELATED SEQUENCE 4-like [Rhododendron vialii]
MPPPDGEIDFGRDVEEEEKEEEEEEEEVGSGDNEEEVLSGTNETTKNCKQRIEEPKVRMEFDTSNEAYVYYLRYAKQQGFSVAKRTSRKGKDENLKNLTLQCNRDGKARVKGSNPVKPRPQTKIDCPAHLIVASYPNGKWRLNLVVLEHNHDQSSEKCRFFKSNRVIDEHVKRKLMLNDKTEIKLPQTYASL